MRGAILDFKLGINLYIVFLNVLVFSSIGADLCIWEHIEERRIG